MRFRPITVAVALALAGTVAGCSSFDPSDMLDFLDTKKKLPGERRALFPEGVPGIEQGIPRDLMKGNQQAQEPIPDQRNATAAVSPPVQAAQPDQPPEAPPGHAAPATRATPPKNTKLTSRRSVTAIPKSEEAAPPAPRQQAAPAPQQQPSAFPAPLPGTFQR